VLLNGADMNAQMIRDGAAWFDPKFKSDLGEERLEIYAQSEQAARNEKRGLWQTEGAVAPWDFLKNEQRKKEIGASTLRSRASTTGRTELSSDSLIRTEKPDTSRSNSDMSWAASAEPKTWQKLEPAGEDFVVFVPSGGRFDRQPVPLGTQIVDVNVYAARDGMTIYGLMWVTGPAMGETDASVIKSVLQGFLRGIGAGYERTGGQFSCEPRSGTDVSTAGFTGRDFSLAGCTIPGVARVFTKSAGGNRHVYIGAAFYTQDDENVDRFLRSFRVGGAGTPTKVTSKRSK
jgi:hypothetical protein